jgi:hypothetical protein
MKKLMFPLACLLLSAGITRAQTEATSSVYAVNTNTDTNKNTVTNTVTVSSRQDDDQPGRTKSFSRSFPASQSDNLSLSNQYGSILIKTWDQKTVKTDVKISAFSNSAEDAQNLLDEVSIAANKSGDLISFSTKIGNHNGNWGSGTRNGRKWRREVRVDYVVYMPALSSLNLSQEYGNVTMGDCAASVSAKVQYGNFQAGYLSNQTNYLNVQYGNTNVVQINKATIKHQYGSGLTLGTVGSLILNAQYVKADIKTITGNAVINQQYGGGLTLGSVGQLNLDAQYTKVRIQSVRRNSNAIKIQYGGLEIGSIENLNLNAQYTGVTIANFAGVGNMKVQYNNLNIVRVSEACRTLNVDAQYVNVGLNFAEGYDANMDVQTSYSGFNHGSNVVARTSGSDDDDSSTKNYSGKIGGGSSSNYVKVKSSYGSVTFK